MKTHFLPLHRPDRLEWRLFFFASPALRLATLAHRARISNNYSYVIAMHHHRCVPLLADHPGRWILPESLGLQDAFGSLLCWSSKLWRSFRRWDGVELKLAEHFFLFRVSTTTPHQHATAGAYCIKLCNTSSEESFQPKVKSARSFFQTNKNKFCEMARDNHMKVTWILW